MKFLLTFLLLFFSISKSIGQDVQNVHVYKRSVNIKRLGKDSVSIPFSDKYLVSDDSCTQITRYAHFNFQRRIFIGKFKDVSHADPKLIVAEGNYNENGLKDGEFITHYLNGNLQAKGSFKDNKYTGQWEFYYENGKPELFFEVIENECHILNSWTTDNKQVIINGKGKYSGGYLGVMIWSGKIVNGLPDGTWEMKVNKDAEPTVTENFEKNKFIYGENIATRYIDSSHIVLVTTNKLPLCTGEKLFPSPYGCNLPAIVNAGYSGGLEAYTDEIKTVVLDYLNRINISSSYHNGFTIDGDVDEKGALINLNSHTTPDLDRKIINQLYKLPLLQPATINGKPVKQKFIITFSFENSYYSFKYSFLPLKPN